MNYGFTPILVMIATLTLVYIIAGFEFAVIMGLALIAGFQAAFE